MNKKEKENHIYEELERVRDLIERIGFNQDVEDILKEIRMEMSETSQQVFSLVNEILKGEKNDDL